MAPQALEGVRVLDASQMLAGPLCGMRLGDLGAEVFKIEPPGRGEWNRSHGFGDATFDGQSTTFLALNRNKRSVALDLKTDEGRDALYRLVEVSDVFLQNYLVGTAARLGVSYDTLSEINPRLVYCSITGYGAVGPYARRPGQDLVLQGYSGSMWSVGAADDPPLPGALWAADTMTGYQATIGILAALNARGTTGRGQHVEVDMLASLMDAQSQELVTFLNAGVKPKRRRQPSAHALIPAPYGAFQTADGYITLAMSSTKALGELFDDEVLKGITSWEDQLARADDITERVAMHLRERTTEECLNGLLGAGMWAGPVYDYDDLANDPHVAERNMIVDIALESGRSMRVPGVPIQMSDTPPRISSPPPPLGADTAAVLSNVLGYDDDTIAALDAAGAIATRKARDS
ncbi:MAG: CoA transferase [Gaiellales bacterium]